MIWNWFMSHILCFLEGNKSLKLAGGINRLIKFKNLLGLFINTNRCSTAAPPPSCCCTCEQLCVLRYLQLPVTPSSSEVLLREKKRSKWKTVKTRRLPVMDTASPFYTKSSLVRPFTHKSTFFLFFFTFITLYMQRVSGEKQTKRQTQ